jgi:outer membrane protein
MVEETALGIAERKERELHRREEEILAAALRRFDSDEWQAVTMDQIAQEAEIGKGTLYLHFASKEEIYAGLALDFGRGLLRRFRSVSAELAPAARLRELMRLFLEEHLARREYRRVVEYCYRDDFRRRVGAEVAAEFAALDTQLFELIDDILSAGIRRGQFAKRPIPVLLIGPHSALIGAARLLWGGCAVFPVSAPEVFIREVCDFVLAGLRGRSPRATRPTPAKAGPRRLARAVLLALALAGGSVAAGWAQQAAPTPPTSAAVRELTLAEALRLAAAASEGVTIAEAGVDRALGVLRQAKSSWRPQLGASTRYTRTLASQFDDIDLGGLGGGDDSGGSADGLGDLPFGQANQYDLGLAVSQTVYSGGRVAAAVAGARAGNDAAQSAVLAARAETAWTVTRAFSDAALAQRLVAIAAEALQQAERALTQTEAAFGEGETAEFEVLRARVARDQQKPELLLRQADQELALLRLRQLLDLPAVPALLLVTDRDEGVAAPNACEDGAAAFAAFPTSSGAEDRADASVAGVAAVCVDPAVVALTRSAVREAEALVRAREAAVAGARAERLPSVGISSEYGRVAYPASGLPGWDETRTNWTVGVGLSLPLLTGGRLAGVRAVAAAELTQARATLQLVREAALLDARDAWLRLRAAAAVWAAVAGTVEQAQRAYEIADVRYREGISTQLELADARLLLQQAEANHAVAERDLRVARARVALLADLPLGVAGGNSQNTSGFNRSGGR